MAARIQAYGLLAENSLTFLNDMIYLQATAVTSNEQLSNQQQATSNHS
jgi:hypothetical protein